MTVISLAFLFAVSSGTAVAGDPTRQETALGRHHLLYDRVIPDDTEVPYGVPGELYDCLSCHEVDTSSGTNRFLVERDCQVCHDLERHHLLYSNEIPYPTDVPRGRPGELYVCLSCHPAETGVSDVHLPVTRSCGRCHHPSTARNVFVDIRPQADPNPLYLGSMGILPVSILGSAFYDVTEIDVASLLLEGQVEPLRAGYEEGADGNLILNLTFSSEAVQALLGEIQLRQSYDVWISGVFRDGSYLLGSDSVVAVGAEGSRSLRHRAWPLGPKPQPRPPR